MRGWAALVVSYYDLLPAGNLTATDSFYYKPIVSAKEFEAEKNPVVDLQSLLPKVQEKLKEATADTVKADTTVKDTVVKKDSTAKDSTTK